MGYEGWFADLWLSGVGKGLWLAGCILSIISVFFFRIFPQYWVLRCFYDNAIGSHTFYSQIQCLI